MNEKILDSVAKILISLLLVATVIYVLLPIFVTLMLTFEPGRFVVFPPTGFSLQWFGAFFNAETFMSGVRTSLFIGSGATLASLGIGIPCAYTLYKHNFRGKNTFQILLLSPLLISTVVLGSSLLIFFQAIHLYTGYVKLLIGHIVITVPYVLRTVTAGLIGYDRRVEEASMNLGANELQTFWHVTLPIIKPAIVAGAVFAFSASLDDVGLAVFLSDARAFTFPVILWGYMRGGLTPLVAAASTVFTLFTVFAVIAIEKTIGLENFTGI